MASLPVSMPPRATPAYYRMIDFLATTKKRKPGKPLNRFMCFRKWYGDHADLQGSPAASGSGKLHQTAISDNASSAWKERTEEDNIYWEQVSIDVQVRHQSLYSDWWELQDQAKLEAARKKGKGASTEPYLSDRPLSQSHTGEYSVVTSWPSAPPAHAA